MSLYRNPAGVDLDLIFAARTSVTAAATNFRNADGLDLNQRYEGLGSQSPSAGTTNFRSPAGLDLRLVFATSSGVPTNFSGSGSSYNPSGGAVTTVTVFTTGNVNAVGSPSGSGTSTQWFSNPRAGLGNDYDVYFTNSGGAGGTWGGTFNTWMQLNVNRSVSLTQTAAGTATNGVVNVQIRRRSDNTVVCTGTYNVSAERG